MTPSMLCNSGRIGEARPIAREHRSQGLRSFSRPSQVFTDCFLDWLGLTSTNEGLLDSNILS